MKRIIIICVSLFCLALVICIVLGISHSSSVFHHNASKLTEEYTGEYDYFYHSRKMLKDVQESPTEFVTPDDLTKIEENTFGNYNELRKIYISRNIRNIDAKAFIHCNNLDSIIVDSRNKYYISRGNCLIEKSTNTLVVGSKNSIIPKGVTTIGKYAFSGCQGLKDIEFPEGVTTIQSSCFDRCKDLASIKIPKSVERIDSGNVFSQCANLKSITVDKDNQFYDSRDNCNCIISTHDNTIITGCNNSIVPKSAKAIGKNAFRGCTKLSQLNIPANSVKEIGINAFADCSALKRIMLPDGVKEIKPLAFANCRSVKEVFISKSVERIGIEYIIGLQGLANHEVAMRDVFLNCDSIKSIVVDKRSPHFDSRKNCNCIIKGNLLIRGCNNSSIPEGVEYISPNAFRNCNDILTLIFPKSLRSISGHAFYNCSNIRKIECKGNRIIEIYNDTFVPDLFFYKKCYLFVPENMTRKYREHELWGHFEHIESIKVSKPLFTRELLINIASTGMLLLLAVIIVIRLIRSRREKIIYRRK